MPASPEHKAVSALASRLHKALRQGCDSKAASLLWNLLNVNEYCIQRFWEKYTERVYTKAILLSTHDERVALLKAAMVDIPARNCAETAVKEALLMLPESEVSGLASYVVGDGTTTNDRLIQAINVVKNALPSWPDAIEAGVDVKLLHSMDEAVKAAYPHDLRDLLERGLDALTVAWKSRNAEPPMDVVVLARQVLEEAAVPA